MVGKVTKSLVLTPVVRATFVLTPLKVIGTLSIKSTVLSVGDPFGTDTKKALYSVQLPVTLKLILILLAPVKSKYEINVEDNLLYQVYPLPLPVVHTEVRS